MGSLRALASASGAHGGGRALERGGGAGWALCALAGTLFHRLARHRPHPGGHPQPVLDSSTGNMGSRCVKEV